MDQSIANQASAADADDGAALHAFAAATLSGTRVPIPVGVGFCLYIRRDCLRDTGEFVKFKSHNLYTHVWFHGLA